MHTEWVSALSITLHASPALAWTPELMAWDVYLGDGTGAVAPGWSTLGQTSRVAYGDVDGDGLGDLVALGVSDDRLRWYPSLGSATFGPAADFAVGIDDPQEIELADVDGDGDLDVWFVLEFGSDASVAWCENLGAGLFAAPVTISGEYGEAKALAIGDLDGDGLLDDVAVANRPWVSFEDGDVVAYASLGGGLFGDAIEVDGRIELPYDVEPVDLDDDGDGTSGAAGSRRPRSWAAPSTPGR